MIHADRRAANRLLVRAAWDWFCFGAAVFFGVPVLLIIALIYLLG